MKNNVTYKKIRRVFEKHGLLLLSDYELPSLTHLVAGEPIQGSWWGHPQGNLMFNLSNELMGEKDVLTVKFINKKITYIHKRHWDILYSLVHMEKEWQFLKLSPAGRKLYETVLKKGSLRADDKSLKQTPAEIGKIANLLEERLLIYTESLHTDSGKHIRILKTWDQAFKDRKYKARPLPYEEAVDAIENLFSEFAPDGLIKRPWLKK